MEAAEKKLKEKETELTEEQLELRRRSGLGCLKGKLHYDDSIWGFYGS